VTPTPSPEPSPTVEPTATPEPTSAPTSTPLPSPTADIDHNVISPTPAANTDNSTIIPGTGIGGIVSPTPLPDGPTINDGSITSEHTGITNFELLVLLIILIAAIVASYIYMSRKSMNEKSKNKRG
jgi:hypothetical protein